MEEEQLDLFPDVDELTQALNSVRAHLEHLEGVAISVTPKHTILHIDGHTLELSSDVNIDMVSLLKMISILLTKRDEKADV